jgi:glycosyltransferase involved in cell wall biosynthesis
MKVAVVTPTIGADAFKKCIQSVQAQSYKDIVHYIFLDGEEHFTKVMMHGIDQEKSIPIKSVGLQENVGKSWYGHRVYAACSFLVNADAICYLDEDNWFEPDHVQSLVSTLENCQWAYSLRKIYSKDEKYLCDDNCESLGKWPVYFDKNVHHIDTSSFIIRRDVAVKIGHAWYGQWGADRQFFHNLKQHFTKFECSGKHTLCYRLDGNPNSVNEEFFTRGNQMQEIVYRKKYPWKK